MSKYNNTTIVEVKGTKVNIILYNSHQVAVKYRQEALLSVVHSMSNNIKLKS